MSQSLSEIPDYMLGWSCDIEATHMTGLAMVSSMSFVFEQLKYDGSKKDVIDLILPDRISFLSEQFDSEEVRLHMDLHFLYILNFTTTHVLLNPEEFSMYFTRIAPHLIDATLKAMDEANIVITAAIASILSSDPGDLPEAPMLS